MQGIVMPKAKVVQVVKPAPVMGRVNLYPEQRIGGWESKIPIRTPTELGRG